MKALVWGPSFNGKHSHDVLCLLVRVLRLSVVPLSRHILRCCQVYEGGEYHDSVSLRGSDRSDIEVFC